jgi:hypothetical protein
MCLLSKKSVKFLLSLRINNYYRGNFLSMVASQLKSFKEIPGPLSLPIIGTLYLYFPFFGKCYCSSNGSKILE